MSASATIESEVAATAGSPIKKVVPTEASAETEKPVKPVENGDGIKDAEPSTSKAKDEKEELVKQGSMNMAAGKRHMLCQDPPAAVAAFSEAAEQLGKAFGETGNELGEAYFYYGKALLEMARMEAGVIDNVLDGVPDTEDEEDSSFVEGPKPTEEECEKIADDVDQALEENFTELQKIQKEKDEGAKAVVGKCISSPSKNGVTNETVKKEEVKVIKFVGNGKTNGVQEVKTDKTNGDQVKPMKKNEESEENSEEDDDEEDKEAEDDPEEKEAAEDEKKEGEEQDEVDEEVKENESIGSNDEGTSNIKDSNDQVAQEQEEEDDPSNLQLAWEMLELAKGILTKHADSLETLSPVRLELESRLSETYQTLGEVSIENENYPQAVEDLTMCLRRRQELLPEDSRCIAETHYQLGVALGFNAQFDEAVNALSDAIAVLEKRIANLKECKESQDPSKKHDAFYTREREIKEIEGIVPEIREKIADTKDMQEETIKKIGDRRLMEEAMCEKFAAAANAAAAAEELPAKNNAFDEPTTTTTEAKSLTPKKSAGNISHLVKKRKKSDEEASEQNGDVKKPHLENGAATATTSSSNGH